MKSNVFNFLSLLISIISIYISIRVYLHDTKGPEIRLITEDEIDVKIEGPTQHRQGSWIWYIINLDFDLIFMNQGSKGGAISNINSKILNLPYFIESNRIPVKGTKDLIETKYELVDSLGMKYDPRFYTNSLDGNESIAVSVLYTAKLFRHGMTGEPDKTFSEILRDFNYPWEVEIKYKWTKIKKKYLIFESEVELKKEIKNLKLHIQWD